MTVQQFSAPGNPTHKLLEDGSVLVTGNNPDRSTYAITTATALKQITALRLEALTHHSMHKGGPGRNKAPVANPNFIVNQFTVKANGQPVKLASATASFSQRNWAVTGAIDGNLKTGWAINPAFGKPAWAIFKLAEPLNLKPGSQLNFTIEQNYGG